MLWFLSIAAKNGYTVASYQFSLPMTELCLGLIIVPPL
ncbi:hypothetical protein [Schnuerera sp.]